MGSKNKNIKIVVGAILVLLVAYWAYTYFSAPSAPAPSGVTVTSGGGADLAKATGADDPFFDLLLGLNTVDLKEKSLLDNPVFKDKMQDFSQPLPTPNVGRPNPFLPVGSNSDAMGSSFQVNSSYIVGTTTNANASSTAKTDKATSTSNNSTTSSLVE